MVLPETNPGCGIDCGRNAQCPVIHDWIHAVGRDLARLTTAQRAAIAVHGGAFHTISGREIAIFLGRAGLGA